LLWKVRRDSQGSTPRLPKLLGGSPRYSRRHAEVATPRFPWQVAEVPTPPGRSPSAPRQYTEAAWLRAEVLLSESMIWTVARTESLRERKAQRWLAQAQFETYLPLVAGKARLGPLFPGYLFVRIGATGWSKVESTIGVLALLRSGDRPAKLADAMIAEIQARERDGVVILPERPRWQPGDRVLVGTGSFFGRIGLFDGMSSRERVFVLLDLFGRQTRVELPLVDLQTVG